jgi:hypothetical protein
MSTQAPHAAGHHLGEGLAEQSAQRRLNAERGEVRAQCGTGQQRKGERIAGPASEQAQQMGGFRHALGAEGIEGQLPGAANQITGIVGANSVGALVDELNGIEAAAVEPLAVVRQGPGADDLMGEEPRQG